MTKLRKGVVVTHEDFNGVDWVNLCQELGLTTLGIHSGGGDAGGSQMLELLAPFRTEEFRQRCLKAGLELEYELHATGMLLTEQLFAAHPEYFRWEEKSGMRSSGANWCSSNPAAIDVLAENALALAKALPSSTHRYMLWAADRIEAWCACESCRKLAFTTQYLSGMNAIARALRTWDPQASLSYLCYHSVTEPLPEDTLEENLFLEFAPYVRSYEYAINDPACETNQVFWKRLCRTLERFPAASAHVLEYWLDSSLFSHYRKPAVRPPFRKDIMRRDLEAYLSLGITDFTTFAVYMDGAYFQANGDRELREYAEVFREFE